MQGCKPAADSPRTGKRPSLLSNTSSTNADSTAWPAPSCSGGVVVGAARGQGSAWGTQTDCMRSYTAIPHGCKQRACKKEATTHMQQRLPLLCAHAGECIIQHKTDGCVRGGVLASVCEYYCCCMRYAPAALRNTRPPAQPSHTFGPFCNESPLTVEEVGLARAVGTHNAVDLGRKRLGDGLVLVALEAINHHLRTDDECSMPAATVWCVRGAACCWQVRALRCGERIRNAAAQRARRVTKRTASSAPRLAARWCLKAHQYHVSTDKSPSLLACLIYISLSLLGCASVARRPPRGSKVQCGYQKVIRMLSDSSYCCTGRCLRRAERSDQVGFSLRIFKDSGSFYRIAIGTMCVSSSSVTTYEQKKKERRHDGMGGKRECQPYRLFHRLRVAHNVSNIHKQLLTDAASPHRRHSPAATAAAVRAAARVPPPAEKQRGLVLEVDVALRSGVQLMHHAADFGGLDAAALEAVRELVCLVLVEIVQGARCSTTYSPPTVPTNTHQRSLQRLW